MNDKIDEYFKDKQKSVEKEEIVLGIDLGTTNSCVSIWRNNKLEVITDKNGERTIPSIVSFTNFNKYIGREAKKQKDINPKNTFYEIKRLIGKKIDDEILEKEEEYRTYDIEGDEKKNVVICSQLRDNRKFTPEEISAMILRELKYMAWEYIGKKITKSVITVPAYFNDSQRQATKDAAKIAGLECVRIINEPTAAALSFGLEKRNEDNINVIVYDFGGGTLDCSLLNISNGVYHVLGVAGNTHLGGCDFDNEIIKYCINKFKKINNIDKMGNINSISLQKLKVKCEIAKKILSIQTNTQIKIKNFYNNIDLNIKFTREKLREISQELLILCMKPIDDVLHECEIKKEDIDDVILVGGCTKIPFVKKNIEIYFNNKPNFTFDPDITVSAGAAIQGYTLFNDHDPFSDSILLLDVVPLSLGIDTMNGLMNVLIPRNSVTPIKQKKTYTTYTDYETSVKIKIFEGERELTKDNFFVGEFILSNIEPAPRGKPKIEVSFNIDTNGIINVSAHDIKNSDNKNNITITNYKNRLTEKEINKLINEAKKYESKDLLCRRKKHYEYKINDMCTNIKNNLDKNSDKLTNNEIEEIKSDIDKILNYLINFSSDEIEEQEYKNIIDKLTSNYSSLLFKNTDEYKNLKTNNNLNLGTSIENNDDNKIDNEKYNYYDKSFCNNYDSDEENDKQETKNYKNKLENLCYILYEVLSDNSLTINDDKKNNLIDYLNDTLLWINVSDKINNTDFTKRFNTINKLSNEISNDAQIDKNILRKNELKKYCYYLKSLIIEYNKYYKNNNTNALNLYIDETLDWLVKIDAQIEYKKKNTNFNFSINMLEETINNYFNKIKKLYQVIPNIDKIEKYITNENNNCDENKNLNTQNNNNNYTTSIEEIMNKNNNSNNL